MGKGFGRGFGSGKGKGKGKGKFKGGSAAVGDGNGWQNMGWVVPAAPGKSGNLSVPSMPQLVAWDDTNSQKKGLLSRFKLKAFSKSSSSPVSPVSAVNSPSVMPPPLEDQINPFIADAVKAVKVGDLGGVVKYLRQGGDANDVDKNGASLLCHASLFGRLEIVAYLVKIGANVNQGDEDGAAALHYAAEDGHIAVMDLLIQHGANVDARTNIGGTALHVTVENGHEESTALLLEASALVNAVDIYGWTALHLAVDCRAWSIARSLLQWGANPNMRSQDGVSVLQMAAAANSSSSNEFLQLALSAQS